MYLLLIMTMVLFIGAGIASAKNYKWTFSSIGSENSFRHQTIKQFKEIIEKKTNGQVKINVMLNGILGSAKETFQSLQMGGIQFQLAAASAVGTAFPGGQILALPFMVSNRDEAYALLEGPIGQKICDALEKSNVKVLAFADLDFVQVTNNIRPINIPDDFKGITVRSPSALQYIATFKTLGSSVSTMPLGEVYMALSQKLIDGQFNPLDTIRTKSIYEVQDYLAIMNMFFYNTYFCMNKDTWDKLDPELQKIVQEAAIEGAKVGRAFSKNQYEKNLKILTPNFKEITYPEIEPFRKKVEPVYSQLEPVMGKEIIQETIEFLKKYRSEKK
jgi:tripartite ATP-independent transporter DctP family solute receptor